MTDNLNNRRARAAGRIALTAGICLAALMATSAHAQVAPTPTPAPTPAAEPAPADEEVVVTGSRPIKESLAAALRTQRESDSLVSVISADGVGRLPDQNIAQAVGRLPGVAVERDQGQARYISLRGAPNYWTTLSFDGINVVSPEGRDARFDSIPSAIASQVIVSKAVTPDMPGETIAGNVNVITRSAFDYSGFKILGKAGAGVAELGSRNQYEGSLVISDRFNLGGGELGVLVSGSYYERGQITDNFETDYERVAQDSRPGNATRFWAQEAENKLYRLTRRNWSSSIRLDWKPDADNTISARSLFTVFTDDEARDNYRFDLDDRQGDLVPNTAECARTVNPTPTTSGYADVCIGNTPQQGTVYGIDIRQRATLRAFRQSIFTNTLTGQHKFGDGWQLLWLGNFTRSRDDRSVVGEASYDSPTTRNLRPTVSYDFSDPNRSRLLLSNTIQLASPTRFQAGARVTAIDSFAKAPVSLTVLDAVDTTDAYTGKLVLTRETRFLGADAIFRAGFQFDQRTKIADENQILLNTAAQFNTVGLPQDYNQFSLNDAFLGQIPLDYTFRYFDINRMRAVANAARANFAFAPRTENNYNVREQVYAGFVMGTLKYDWGSVVGGVRVESLNNRGIAVATVGTTRGVVTAEASQTLVFPSLHINWNVDSTKKLRLSFNSGAARADYDQFRPNVVVNDPNQTISGGNPAIKPERAYGVDAYFEWYLKPQGYLSIGFYYKNVEDVLFNSRRTFGSNALDSNGVDRSGYFFTGITNGGSGRLFGLEATAQLQLDPWVRDLGLPEWTGGFGISSNVTLNDSRVTKPAITTVPARQLRLPGTSDLIYNLGAYYEKYGLSVNFQYQWRSDYLDSVADDLTDAGDTYWAADEEVDMSLRYAVTKNFEVYFDIQNLFNQPGRRYSEPGNLLTATGIPSPTSTIQTIEWERFARRFSGGVRFSF
ncbi:MAG: TonB-dependent receptor [Sphingomonas sp.]|uniref:TonB-dependent receptor n=1 Tax=Sphingomonas sp. TaxID=28214 RepID=UPI0025EFE025|nr:TonB-dependent receptor [Sphingomonas sp.]MBY0284858.1 TonB-dependent receptor [Sphingomonas sp.]